MKAHFKVSKKSRIKEYTIEKIKLNEKPKIRKYLKEFFQNPSNYFNDQFDNKQLIIGKAKTTKFEVPVPKKYQRRRNRVKTRVVHINNESLSDQISLFNEKRRNFKGTIESSLKEGQRYINDREINDIFKAFEKVREINKTKNKDFITTKDLVDSIYIYNYDSKKSYKNQKFFFKEINQNIFQNHPHNKDKRLVSSCKSLMYDRINKDNMNISNPSIIFDKRQISQSLKRIKSSVSQQDYQYGNNNKLIPKILLQNKENTSLLKDKTINNKYNSIDNSEVNSQNTTKYKIRPKSLISKFTKTNNKFKDSVDKEKIRKRLLENEKLMEKQTQYLPNTNQELIKNEIAKRLASQEKALIYNIKVKNKENNLLDVLSKKLKKQKSELMLGQIEDHRISKNIKLKLNKLIRKTTPGQNYKWEQDLRNSKNEEEDSSKIINDDLINYQKRCSLYKNEEIARDPCYKTFYSTYNKFRNQDKEYLRNRVSKRLYNRFMKDINNLKSNYDGFLIEGQSLLKHEHNIIKKLKGKKIINNYDSNINIHDTNDELYATNFDINKF